MLLGAAASIPMIYGAVLASGGHETGDGDLVGGVMVLGSAPIAAAALGVGVPLWAVGQSQITSEENRGRLSIAPIVNGHATTGAVGTVVFPF